MRCFSILGLALLAAASTAFAEIDHGLLNLVPQGTQVLAGFQVDKGKTSALGQYLLQRAGSEEPQFQKFMDATGFDPRRDLQEVLVATPGPATAGKHSIIVLARGTFDVTHMKKGLVAKGGRVENYQGVDLLLGGRSDSGSVAFLDSTLAVAGDRDLVQSVIANRSVPSTIDSQLMHKADKLSQDNQAWFASLVPGSALPQRERPGQNPKINTAAIQSVLQSSGGIRLNSNSVDVAFDAVTRSEKDALALCDVVRFFASMVQMQRNNEGPMALLAPSLDEMQLTATGDQMHLSLSVPEKVVEQILNQGGPRRRTASLTH
jgi:hypothetical protein